MLFLGWPPPPFPSHTFPYLAFTSRGGCLSQAFQAIHHCASFGLPAAVLTCFCLSAPVRPGRSPSANQVGGPPSMANERKSGCSAPERPLDRESSEPSPNGVAVCCWVREIDCLSLLAICHGFCRVVGDARCSLTYALPRTHSVRSTENPPAASTSLREGALLSAAFTREAAMT